MKRLYALLLLSIAGCDAAPSGAADASATCPTAALQRALDDAVANRPEPGAVVGVSREAGCSWHGAAGQANIADATAVVPSDRFRIGSVTKTFTAAVVLQLTEEGTLRLDDTLEQWVPGIPGGTDITIRHLLSHTSGIYNYTDDRFPFGQDWEPAELVALATSHANLFEPGTDWAYSNTNYVLLGMIIEEATGQTWAAQVRGRLLEPLGLADTFMEGEETIPGGFVRGYFNGTLDVTDLMNGSEAWAAGCMVSNSQDLVRWTHALFGGEVLEPATLAAMVAPTPLSSGKMTGCWEGTSYGLGVQLRDTDHGVCWGHGGSAVGFGAQLCYFPDQRAATATVINDSAACPWPFLEPLWPLVLDANGSVGQLGHRQLTRQQALHRL